MTFPCLRLCQCNHFKVRHTTHSPLALLSVDLGADGCDLDSILGEVIVVDVHNTCTSLLYLL